MNTFYLSESLFCIVWLIALFVLREFWLSKNGALRKLMIAYFAIEFYTYFAATIYYLGVHKGWAVPSSDIYRVLVVIPKVTVKLLLLRWLIRNRNK